MRGDVDMDSDRTAISAEPADVSGRFRLGYAVLAVAVVFLAGLFVVDTIGALEPDDDCQIYGGSGGYGCPVIDDAVIELSQSTDLVDRQTVDITGSLFDPPNTQWAAAMCAASVSETMGIESCDLRTTVWSSTDADGSVTAQMTVRRIIEAGGNTIDCAEPGACVIGGATLAGAISPIEGTAVPVQFDPDTPPAPVPGIEIAVEHIDGTTATIVVECSNATELNVWVEAYQEIDGLHGYVWGGYDTYGEDFECGDSPFEVEIALMAGGDRRLGRGEVMWYASGYASDGYESAYASAEGTFQLRRTPRIQYVTDAQDGQALSAEIIGVKGRDADQELKVRVQCDRPLARVDLNLNIVQWARLDGIRAHGYTSIENCDGTVRVDVPFDPSNGLLRSGRAQAEVYLNAYDPGNEDPFFYDYAMVRDAVWLRGTDAAPLLYGEPDPDSRISIDHVSRTGVQGTVTCEEPVDVWISVETRHYEGRIIRSAWQGEDQFACDGATSFERDFESPMPRWARVGVLVSASATQPGGPSWPSLWYDMQVRETRVSR